MEWTRGPVIGRGATATVNLATDKVSGEIFAVKSSELSRAPPLKNEQYILSKLKLSPRIVKYLGFSITEEEIPRYNLAIEYVPNGTLYDAIRARGKLDEPSIKLYARQILEGLDHLHENSIAHCDIKSQNILIGSDGGAKIADFGCARLVPSSLGLGPTSFSGTPGFMAPETARGERQGFEADVWALGCMIIEMATGRGPWPDSGDSPVSILYRIGYSGLVPSLTGTFSIEGNDFLNKCFQKDWRQRWTVKELLEHAFLRESLKFESNSPSSVLEKDLFWDFVEVSDESPRELGFEECSVSHSVLERIRILSGISDSISNSSVHDGDDEDWLTVRDSENEDIDEQEVTETFMAYDDREENDDYDFIIDGNVFGQELSIEIFSQASDIFCVTSFVVTSCNNNVDVKIEMNNKNFCLDSISFSNFTFLAYLPTCQQDFNHQASNDLEALEFK